MLSSLKYYLAVYCNLSLLTTVLWFMSLSHGLSRLEVTVFVYKQDDVTAVPTPRLGVLFCPGAYCSLYVLLFFVWTLVICCKT